MVDINIEREDIEQAKSILKSSPELLASLTLLLLGLLLLFIGILFGTTRYFAELIGIPEYVTLSVTLLGIAVPSLLLGVFILLPSRKSQKLGTGGGILFTAIGIFLFNMSYPQALGSTMFMVAMTYSIGVVLMLSYLFLGVANVNSTPERVVKRKYKRRSRVSAYESNKPKTGLDVIKEIIRQKIPTDDDEFDDNEPRIDISEVAESFEEDMSRNKDMIESITVSSDTIEVKKRGNVSDARFVTAIPEYVSVDSVTGNIYKLKPREEDYLLRHDLDG